jgi:hypothetical protein
MYFFYVDESGNLDPTVSGERADGSGFVKDHVYVLAAVSLYEHRWHGFDKVLNRKKWELIDIIFRAKLLPAKLELADCEVKSTWTRIPKERAKRPFLANLTDTDLKQLVDLYYHQLAHHHMRVFGVVVDKRHLHGYMDSTKMHRKAWELLLEQIEAYLREEHPKHQGVLITDDVSRQQNRSLAMKHAYIQSEGTAAGIWLSHIAEMPLFVRSELSNGVQLTDLLAYNIYRCFRYENPDYPFFAQTLPHIWVSKKTPTGVIDGLRVFPPESPLTALLPAIATRRAGSETAGP